MYGPYYIGDDYINWPTKTLMFWPSLELENNKGCSRESSFLRFTVILSRENIIEVLSSVYLN